MKTFIVLGMHGSGTSLVAGALRAMGIRMGTEFMGPVKDYETHEDKDFVKVNAKVLQACGGDWAHPPDPKRIETAFKSDDLLMEMVRLVRQKEQENEYRDWGWKDPRNSLTVGLWHQITVSPCYIVVRRNEQAVARSMLSRGPSAFAEADWVKLAQEYYARIQLFLSAARVPSLTLHYEDLTDRDKAARVFQKLAWFLGIRDGETAVKAAMGMVRFGDD